MSEILSGLEDGTIVMLIGMVVVFLFLTILVLAMHLMSKIVLYFDKIFPQPVVETAYKKKSGKSNDEQVAVAIAALISKM